MYSESVVVIGGAVVAFIGDDVAPVVWVEEFVIGVPAAAGALLCGSSFGEDSRALVVTD